MHADLRWVLPGSKNIGMMREGGSQMNMRNLEDSFYKMRSLLSDVSPKCAVILGSGWNTVIDEFESLIEIPYSLVPSLRRTTVPGHEGKIIFARAEKAEVLFFCGRRHWYEGEGWEPIIFPVYAVLKLGIPILVLTNAAGGIRPDLEAGQLMVIDDHINCMGVNPLIGLPRDGWIPRFPDMREVYDNELRILIDKCAGQTGIRIAHGVYAAVSGPSYETPSEIRSLERLGADAVGMSTVPEAIVGHAGGLKIAGLSCIANKSASAERVGMTHAEVLATVRATACLMKSLLIAFLKMVMH